MFVLHENWADRITWNDFVSRHVEARFCHLFDYSEALRCYGYQTQRLCFTYRSGQRQGAIAAVLPMTLVGNRWYGHRLISQPFCEYGGLLMDPALSSEEVHELILALRRHLSNGSQAVLEIHGNLGVPTEHRHSFVQRNPHMLAFLPLHPGPEQIWTKSIKQEARKSVNKARRSGLSVLEECTPEAIRRHFYPLYMASMKRLGVPPHNVDFYLDCQRLFGDRMQIFWALKGSERVAALLGFSSGVRTAILNTVSDPASWSLCPNDLLHWEYICNAIERGCAYFDFGSIRYDGQRLFKSKWGTSIIEQGYAFMTANSRPVHTFDSSSWVMEGLSTLWARYMPFRLAQHLGPEVRRFLAR